MTRDPARSQKQLYRCEKWDRGQRHQNPRHHEPSVDISPSLSPLLKREREGEEEAAHHATCVGWHIYKEVAMSTDTEQRLNPATGKPYSIQNGDLVVMKENDYHNPDQLPEGFIGRAVWFGKSKSGRPRIGIVTPEDFEKEREERDVLFTSQWSVRTATKEEVEKAATKKVAKKKTTRKKATRRSR